jgi:hypothetical protein
MIDKLARVLGSKTKAQELLFLVNDFKAVVRQGFYEEELPAVEDFCKQNRLFFVKSKFKVLLADENAYSNKGIRIEWNDQRKGMYFVYISKDEQKAWLASYHELMSEDYKLGLLLGYPLCCIDFFCKRFSDNNPNLQLTPTNAFTNLTKRDKDCVLISHFPCDSDCKDSVELGIQYLTCINKFDKERADEIAITLSI